jgi:hypothetical protein
MSAVADCVLSDTMRRLTEDLPLVVLRDVTLRDVVLP